MADNPGVNPPERLAPHSLDAEEAVLGSILINPDAIMEISAFLQPSDFFIVKNQWVYEAILAVAERGDAIDTLVVSQELKAAGRLEQVGGPAHILYLSNSTPTHIHAETYGRIVERASIRRRLLGAASEIGKIALEEDAEISDVIDDAESALFKVTQRRIEGRMHSAYSAVSDYYDHIEELYNSDTKLAGIPSGFPALDEIIGGFEREDLIVAAARPAIGKSALMLNIGHLLAKQYGLRVGVFSLEMSINQLMNRIVAAETSINANKLRVGKLDGNEWGLFTEAASRIGQWKMYFDDSSAINLNSLRAKCRRLAAQEGLDLIIVDYLQIMADMERSKRSREEIVSDLARGLKQLAREMRVPVLTASQLNRELEKRSDKRPTLADLRESGEIEQSANVVIGLYREEVYNSQAEPGLTEAIVLKNRQGPTGTANLRYRKEFTQFLNIGVKKAS